MVANQKIVGRILGHRLADVKPREISWLWPGRIALGKLTLLVGDPGLGKSFIMLDIAARLSRAGEFPDAAYPFRLPGQTLLLSAEDDPADTIRPRLDRMNADASKITAVSGIAYPGACTDLPRLDRDIEAIDAALSSCERPRLVVIDPISAYMGDADANSNAEVRRVLARLARMAAKNNVAVIAVSHLTKGQQTKTLYRAMGSLAFTAAARTVYAVSKDPLDSSRCVVVPVKSNVQVTKTAMAYRIDDGRLVWLDCGVKMQVEELDRAPSPDEPDSDSIEEAAGWLEHMLAKGGMSASALFEAAARDGVAVATLRRAKRRLGVQARRVGGSDGRWVWERPGTPGSTSALNDADDGQLAGAV